VYCHTLRKLCQLVLLLKVVFFIGVYPRFEVRVFRIAILGGYTVVLGGGNEDRGPRVRSGGKGAKSNTLV